MVRSGPAVRRSFPAVLARLALVVALLALAPASRGASPSAVPPPTPVPVPPNGSPSPSPFPTVLQTPPPTAGAPDIGAPAAVLADLDSGQVLFASNARERRPVASLTKIMTAYLVLERARPSDVATVSEAAAALGHSIGFSELGLAPGERIAVSELLYALLLESANDAAVALAETVAGSVERFVSAMNAQARKLGLADTRFYSPNGLDDRGYSSALDLVRLTRAAYRFPAFAQIVRTEFHDVPSPEGEPRHIQNRNVLLWLYPGAVGVKTGFTTAAGHCVVAVAQQRGVHLVAVVLGAASESEPFSEAAALLNYGFVGFERRLLVEKGEPFGTVPIAGRHIPVVAAASLERLVPVEKAGAVAKRLVARAGVQFPPAVGEPVASLTVAVPGGTLGRVPLIVSSVPPPPPPEPGPWWGRATAATLEAVGSLLNALLS